MGDSGLHMWDSGSDLMSVASLRRDERNVGHTAVVLKSVSAVCDQIRSDVVGTGSGDWSVAE